MLWRLYLSRLQSHPISTKLISSSVLFFSSDMLAQTLSHQDWDILRSLRSGVFGGFYAPVLHYWIRLLESKVKIPNHLNLQAVARVLPHTMIFAPIFVSGMIFFMEYTRKKGTWESAKERVEKYGIALWKQGLGYWLPVMYLGYRYWSVEHRVLVINVASLLWTCYVSYTAVGPQRKSD
jgi:hypothetical protein